MKRWAIGCVLGLLGSLLGCSSGLKPFSSDGCSAFPDGTLSQSKLWLACCVAHDVSYWKGGTRQQRLHADNELRSCVAKVGEPEIALLMLAGVRVGGSPYFPTSFRWGYGWSYPKGYGKLTELELQLLEAMMPGSVEDKTPAQTTNSN